MTDPCECAPSFDGRSSAFVRIMWIVIALNGTMFIVESMAGIVADSRALRADALDFLADTATYTLTLLVIGRPLRIRAIAALVKGLSLGGMALWVLASTVYGSIYQTLPESSVMGGIGLLALSVNLTSVALLLRYREGDANIHSVWLCSRNDAIGNLAVIVAAAAVWGTGGPWPDLAVAAVMAGLFLHSSLQIIRRATADYRHSEKHVIPGQ